ncbi:DNA cytosine methyltransferase [Corynebacterium sp. AOP34-AQ2-28]|uniref:DNA cytosine methyltransferase n=1 Tax=Corynebacterium sp. AOP34-AQ2-28 TaxID=3457689 RepID=UPI004034D066
MSLTIGSLFSGYGGLDLAVESVTGARTAWHCEYDDAPALILAHHWPDVPNHRDVTTIDWSTVEPVDIITGGSPCQDLSAAGKRAGMTEGTRSNLWVNMREAIAALRPRLVVWENVRGALSATATSDSDMESEGGPLGTRVGGARTSSGSRTCTRRPCRARV